MPSDYDLTLEDVKEGIRLCHTNVNRLLDDAEVIISKDHGAISSGLYTYAIEELGKLLLLQEMLKIPSVGIISANPEIFGYGKVKHPKIKFNKFLLEPTIPKECKKINLVIGGVPITQHVRVGKVLIPINTGIIPVHHEVSMNFQIRKKVFYVGRENRAWIKHQDVEIYNLQQAITKLRKWVSTNISSP